MQWCMSVPHKSTTWHAAGGEQCLDTTVLSHKPFVRKQSSAEVELLPGGGGDSGYIRLHDTYDLVSHDTV